MLAGQPVSRMKILNATGECLLDQAFDANIDLRQYPAGIYFLELSDKNGLSYRQKLIKE